MAALILPWPVCCVTRRIRVQTCKRWWTMFWVRSLHHHQGWESCSHHNECPWPKSIVIFYEMAPSIAKFGTFIPNIEHHQTLFTFTCFQFFDNSEVYISTGTSDPSSLTWPVLSVHISSVVSPSLPLRIFIDIALPENMKNYQNHGAAQPHKVLICKMGHRCHDEDDMG